MGKPAHPVIAAIGLTQNDVARLMGCSPSHVGAVFNDEHKASPEFRSGFLALVEDLVFGPGEEWFPTEPLIKHIQNACDDNPSGWCKHRGLSWSYYQKTKAISLAAADFACGKLRVHLSEIWGPV